MDDREKLATLEALERENQRLRRELTRLDEMPRKKQPTVSDLSGVSDLNTSISKGIRSMPGAEDRYYLDLYLLQKHMERNKKMTGWIKKWRLRIGRQMGDLEKESAKKEALAIDHMAILVEEPAGGEPERSEPRSKGEEAAPKKYVYKPDEWKATPLEY